MAYNGHKNRNHWNVSLWLNNDERLYRQMQHYCRYAGNRRDAARMMLEDLAACGITKTPDGAPYTVTAIRNAMVGL